MDRYIFMNTDACNPYTFIYMVIIEDYAGKQKLQPFSFTILSFCQYQTTLYLVWV